MKSLRMTLIALTSIALLSACDRGGGRPSSQGSQSQAPQTDTSSTEGGRTASGKTSTEEQAKVPEKSGTEVSSSQPEVTTGQGPEVEPSTQSEGLLRDTYKSIQNSWTATSNQVAELATDLSEGVVYGYHEVRDATRTLVSPTSEEELRSETLRQINSHSAESRNQELQDAQAALAGTRPAPLAEVTAAVRPNDEVSNLLVELIAEPDVQKAQEHSEALVEEIFNEPEAARIKVMKLQLGIKELNEQGLYDEDASHRVAYLQSVLDEEIQKEGNTSLLRDSLIVAGTSLTLGAIAGFHGFDGVRRYVSDFSVRRSLSSAKDGVSSSVRATRDKVGSLFKRSSVPPSQSAEAIKAANAAWGAKTGFRRGLATFRLSSDNVVQRDIVALGLRPDKAKDLSLKVVPRNSVGFQDFKPTNMPGLRYSVVDQWANESLGTRRKIIFSIVRRDHLSARPVVVASRTLPTKDANAIAKKLEYKPPEEGGKEFVAVIDPESGVVTPTRMPVAELEATGPALKPATRAKRTTKSSKAAATQAEAESVTAPVVTAEEVVSPPPAVAAETSSSTVETIKKVGTIGKLANSARSIGTKFRNFNWSWAATVAAATEIPFQGFLMEGYRAGKSYGEGHDALYLESLIPPNRIDQLSFEMNELSNQ